MGYTFAFVLVLVGAFALRLQCGAQDSSGEPEEAYSSGGTLRKNRRGFTDIVTHMTGMDDNIVRIWNGGWEKYVHRAMTHTFRDKPKAAKTARRGFNQVLNSMTGMDDNIVRVWNKGWDQYVNKALRNYKNAPRPGQKRSKRSFADTMKYMTEMSDFFKREMNKTWARAAKKFGMLINTTTTSTPPPPPPPSRRFIIKNPLKDATDEADDDNSGDDNNKAEMFPLIDKLRKRNFDDIMHYLSSMDGYDQNINHMWNNAIRQYSNGKQAYRNKSNNNNNNNNKAATDQEISTAQKKGGSSELFTEVDLPQNDSVSEEDNNVDPKKLKRLLDDLFEQTRKIQVAIKRAGAVICKKQLPPTLKRNERNVTMFCSTLKDIIVDIQQLYLKY